jgi:hypothetical protein
MACGLAMILAASLFPRLHQPRILRGRALPCSLPLSEPKRLVDRVAAIDGVAAVEPGISVELLWYPRLEEPAGGNLRSVPDFGLMNSTGSSCDWTLAQSSWAAGAGE